MSQKIYLVGIVQSLLRSPSHVRSLAKQLRTNQMTISRKIKELEAKNVVDYKQEGRNKVYFIKKTIESQEYVFISEHHKLMEVLQQHPLLRSIVQRIKSNPKINLAVLFGSYAKGLAHKDSDIDIYVETENKDLKKEIEPINTRINVKIGKYDQSSILIREIEKDHIIIKGVEKYYEKNKFFA